MGAFVNPQNNTSEISAIVDQSKQLVQEKFTQALAYGDGAKAACEAFLATLGQAANEAGYTPANAPILTINPIAYSFNPGEAPVAPAVELDVPGVPTVPTFEDVTIVPQVVPTFEDVAPEVNLPDAPSLELPSPPSDIPEMTPIEFPDKPVVTLPDLPTFLPVTIPEVPTANFPTFDAAAPEESLIVPNNIMGIVHDTYESAIKTALQNKILNDILNGGTGLNPSVEMEIWRREEERSRLALEEAKEKIAAEWSKRGFSLPDGVLAEQLAQAEREYANKRMDVSRDIAIKQAELAFQNTQFIIQQGLALESTLINFANAVAQRAFESTKALQDVSIAIFNASLAKYQVQLEAYKTKAAVFETLIRGEIGKAEFYKAQVAAAQVTADVNRAYADLYRIQVQGVEELIKMYATEMEAAKIKSDVDRNRIEVFKAQIEGFTAQVNAKTAELHLHQARIEGEKAKVQVYASQVDAFSKRVEAAKTEGSIKIEEARAKAENNRNLVARYSADIDAYKARLQGLVEKMNAALKAYEASGVVFRAKADAQAAIANVDVKARESAIHALIAQMNLSLREAEVNIRAHHDSAQLKVAAAEGGARVAAQLAAGIFSGVSVQAHINASAGASKNYSGAEQVTESYPHKPV